AAELALQDFVVVLATHGCSLLPLGRLLRARGAHALEEPPRRGIRLFVGLALAVFEMIDERRSRDARGPPGVLTGIGAERLQVASRGRLEAIASLVGDAALNRLQAQSAATSERRGVGAVSGDDVLEDVLPLAVGAALVARALRPRL